MRFDRMQAASTSHVHTHVCSQRRQFCANSKAALAHWGEMDSFCVLELVQASFQRKNTFFTSFFLTEQKVKLAHLSRSVLHSLAFCVLNLIFINNKGCLGSTIVIAVLQMLKRRFVQTPNVTFGNILYTSYMSFYLSPILEIEK
ncbi:hypothetical protein ILYODFUR_032635 [Ilyodon furcidens]|uniref:Uncharacterized protein n=1 Tax=Ilyodon furcidens TaxID=33524 RepID=A0ABV0UPR2_9TELE